MSVSVSETPAPRRLSSDSVSDNDQDNEPNFQPAVTLPLIEISTNEENEEELIKLRAKLFRFDTSDPDLPEWKERGTGEVKLLRHRETNSVRVVMRRDKTLKICANHFITPWMELKPSYCSNRAWVWTVLADFADEVAKKECLAIRFATPEIAAQWKEKFEEAKTILKEKCTLYRDDYTDNEESAGNDSVDESDENDENNENDKSDKTDLSDKKEENKSHEDKILIKNMSDLNV